MVEPANIIKEMYPNINWDLFEDMDRALNWELWHGTLPDNYWTEVEPLDHYTWVGFSQAEDDIRAILEPVASELYWDRDCDFMCENDPYDDDELWIEEEDDEYYFAGGDNWTKIDPREVLMHVETYRQVM